MLDDVISACPRTGSNRLAESLAAIGAGRPLEYLNPITIRGKVMVARPGFLEPDPVAYLERIRSENRVNGVFGMKIHYPQLVAFSGEADSLARLLPEARYISITRRRALRQGVSYAKATQSGVWRAGMRELREPRFNQLRILKHLLFVAQELEQWERFYERNGIRPLRLVYEDIDDDDDLEMGRVIRFLGLEAGIPSRPLARQADRVTEEWVDRSVRFLRQDGSLMRLVRGITRTW